MPEKIPAVAAVALLAALTVAGCIATTSTDPEFTVPEDADAEAHQEDVSDPHVVEVAVTSETDDGDPLEDAAVVFYRYEDGDATVDTEVETRSGAGPDGARSETRVDVAFSAPEVEVLAVGRTDGEGTVRGHLAPSTTVEVAVGDVPDYTNEVRSRVAVGEAGERSSVTVPLYQETLEIDVEDAMPTSASAEKATLGFAEPARHPVEVSFHDDEDAQKAYLDRVEDVDVMLTWDNGPTQYGDLYAGLSTGGEQPFVVGEDDVEPPVPGTYMESVSAEEGTLDDVRSDLVHDGLHVDALSGSASAGLDGLPFAFEGHARFEGSGVTFSS